MPTLYLVGTPIGNLGDISPRALDALREADFIAAEDTRMSIKLLNHFGIKKPMVSYYEHNSRERGAQIAQRILAGESCAVITDAGMPCISDPGEDLVRLCAENGITVTVVPGPSALVSALAASGLPTGRFAFEGFLSVKKGSRMEHLKEVAGDTRTLIFYEAPHKLSQTLADMLEIFGDRRVALCRELTKLHEEVLRTTLSEAVRHFEATPPRGEFVLVVEGAEKKAPDKISFEQALDMTKKLIGDGRKPSLAARDAAKATGYPKSSLYRAVMSDTEEKQ